MSAEAYNFGRDGIPTIVKTEPGKLDYPCDWSDWLPAGDSIASYEVTAQTGITLVSDERAGAVVVAWLSGGRHGFTYLVRFRITTAAGRIEERTIAVAVVYARG